MPAITVTLELTDTESRLLDLFITAEGSRQTREQVASRLAFLWLRQQLKAIADNAYQKNLDLTIRMFNRADATTRGRMFEALGLDFDGLSVRVKPVPLPSPPESPLLVDAPITE